MSLMNLQARIFCTIAYASLHILAQFLRSAAGAANEMEDRIEHRPHMQIAVSKSMAQAKWAGSSFAHKGFRGLLGSIVHSTYNLSLGVT